MTFTVTIHWSNKAPEVHHVSRAQALALADYTTRTFPGVEVTIRLEV